MKFYRYFRERLLPVLVSRTVVFLFLMCFLTLFLYAAGTMQGFIDSTQIFLLRLYSVLGIFFTVVSAYAAVFNIGRFLKQKKGRYILRIALYVFFALSGAASVLAVMFIITVSGGN